MAANKYGIQIKSFKEGLVEVHIRNWILLDNTLPNLVNDLENDCDIYYVTGNRDENTITISYNHDAIENKDTVERWITIFQTYSNDSPL